MDFRPCAIIPTYNHHVRLADVVAGLRRFDLPIIIVDDGSASPAGAAIAALHAPDQGVEVLRLDRNRGKGAAMMVGFAHAIGGAFTHALQIDADGQHDPALAERFLASAHSQPLAVICGQAIYDETVPKARKYGRNITHACVWAETASLAISDSMCGYRLYPLNAVRPLLASNRVGARMEFDTEILVHLYWDGAPVIMLPVGVVYPPDNTSNFRMLHDNIRISLMHTRLLIQAPFRLAWRGLVMVKRRVGAV